MKNYFTVVKEINESITDRVLGLPEKTLFDRLAAQYSNAIQPSITKVLQDIDERLMAWGLTLSKSVLDATYDKSGSISNMPIYDIISNQPVPNGTFSISWEPMMAGISYQYRADFLSCKVTMSFDIDEKYHNPPAPGYGYQDTGLV